jgi:hypothetical protein
MIKNTARRITAASFLIIIAGLSLFLRLVDIRRGFVYVKNSIILRTINPDLFSVVVNLKFYFAFAAFGGALLLLIPVLKTIRYKRDK